VTLVILMIDVKYKNILLDKNRGYATITIKRYIKAAGSERMTVIRDLPQIQR